MSRAEKGSLEAPRNGDGLEFDTFGPFSDFVGLPRRIGVMSGISCFASVGGALKAPTTGGVAVFCLGDGRC